MGAAEYLRLDDDTLLAQCDVHTFRASGPGGQKRNKTSSAVRLHHRPTTLMAKAAEDRSQHVNKRRALRRLRRALATDILEALDLTTYARSAEVAGAVDSGGRLRWRPRSVEADLVINEVLSLLNSATGRTAAAAACLGIATANLIQVLESDPQVWRAANRIRQAHGRKALVTSRG